MLSLSTLPVPSVHHDLSSSIRGFKLTRFKHNAASLLKHGHFLPAQHHLNEAKRHNSQIHACRLPEEILRKIFVFTAQSSVGLKEFENWSWVNITYVCSTWRQVALDYKDVWRYIDFSQPRWYNATLPRAKMSALHVQAFVNEKSVRQLQSTLQLAHQIQDVHLTSSVQNIEPLLEILAHPNPATESMTINVLSAENPTENTYDPPIFPTSGVPLRNLKYMELHNAPFYLLTSRCTALREFHLHDLPFTERPTLRYFLFMLEQLAQLEHLTLDRAFPINLDDHQLRAIEKPINLPRLKSLTLAGSIADVANILDFFSLSPHVRLVIKIRTLSDMEANLWRFVQAIGSRSWATFDTRPLQTLVLTSHQKPPRLLNGFQKNPEFQQDLRIRAFAENSSSGGAALDVLIRPDDECPTDDDLIECLAAIWKGLALSQVHRLVLEDIDIVTQKSWSNFLRTLPSLRVLDVSGCAPSGLVWALLLDARPRKRHGESSGLEAQRLLVPRLNDIYLHRVNCSRGGFMVKRNAPTNSLFDLDDSPFLDVLIRALAQRRRYGLCSRSLSIAQCEFVARRSVDAARKAVTHLIFDLRNVIRDTDALTSYAARYAEDLDTSHPSVRHYNRLRTLVQLDAET
ncbi:hypothetical protein CVT24_003219 [Panaeolus cyanescens]|uniref:F-box domain-containing protein n=1 Tax=Panaeolus cyanescens TaxID=181874 RepID=A0A409VFV5_9AGAR|nr:hypothetical protein CVT24_003219 [Panaeolus cyanescens]